MEMNELLELGAKAFMNSNLTGEAGNNLDLQSIVSALSGLTGGNGFDIASIVDLLNNGGLGSLASSWLGDGNNAGISAEQIMGVFGNGRIAEFASQLGLTTEEAAGGLSEALPKIVDKASIGGTLLDSIGGIEGAVGLAGKLFGR